MAYTHVCIYIFMHYSPVRLWNGFPYNFSSDVLRSHNLHLSASLCMCVCLCVSACERISFVATTLGNCTTMAESRAAFGLSFTDVHIHIYVYTWGHIEDTWCVLAVAAPPANTSLAQFFGFTLYLYSTVFADKIPYMCRLVLLSYCAIAFTSLVCLCFARLLAHTRLFVCVCVCVCGLLTFSAQLRLLQWRVYLPPPAALLPLLLTFYCCCCTAATAGVCWLHISLSLLFTLSKQMIFRSFIYSAASWLWVVLRLHCGKTKTKATIAVLPPVNAVIKIQIVFTHKHSKCLDIRQYCSNGFAHRFSKEFMRFALYES